jgi:hypothetical protein
MTLKAGIVEPDTSIARQRLGKQVPAAMDAKLQRKNCWNRCFVFGPCKVVIGETTGGNESVENRQEKIIERDS